MEKPKLCYRVVKGKNPRTGEKILRSVIANLESCRLEEIVRRVTNGDFTSRGVEIVRGEINNILLPIGKFRWSDVSRDEARPSLCISKFRTRGELTDRLRVRGREFEVRGPQTLSMIKNGTRPQLVWRTPEGESRAVAVMPNLRMPGEWHFDWPSEFDELPDGTEVVFSVTCTTVFHNELVHRYGEARATIVAESPWKRP